MENEHEQWADTDDVANTGVKSSLMKPKFIQKWVGQIDRNYEQVLFGYVSSK